jgi:hypothetical protein
MLTIRKWECVDNNPLHLDCEFIALKERANVLQHLQVTWIKKRIAPLHDKNLFAKMNVHSIDLSTFLFQGGVIERGTKTRGRRIFPRMSPMRRSTPYS